MGSTQFAGPSFHSRAHITVNKNSIPNDPQKPFVTSGIRIGSPAMTTRGFTEIEAERIAHLIADVLDKPNDEANLENVRAKVADLPLTFAFDDTMALPGGQKISDLPAITVEARVAKSGQAQSASGDLFGSVSGIKPGSQGIKVVIDQVQP
jgi:hypothetical protein